MRILKCPKMNLHHFVFAISFLVLIFITSVGIYFQVKVKEERITQVYI